MPAGSSVGCARSLGRRLDQELRDRRDACVAFMADRLGQRTSRRAAERVALAELQVVGPAEEEVVGVAHLVRTDARCSHAHEREVLEPEQPPGGEAALARHPAAAAVVAVPHLAAAVGADLRPRRVSLATLDDRRVGIERDPPERRVAREHDRVAAPIEKSARRRSSPRTTSIRCARRRRTPCSRRGCRGSRCRSVSLRTS